MSRAGSKAKARRYWTLAVGWGLLATGIVLLFLPGPGLLVILAALAVLGREMPWASRINQRLRAFFRSRRARSLPAKRPALTPTPEETSAPR